MHRANHSSSSCNSIVHNADVLLDSGLNLFDIMANLSSKLFCVSIEVDFCFGLQQERLCKTDLSGTTVMQQTCSTLNFTCCKTLVLIASFSNIVGRCEFVSRERE